MNSRMLVGLFATCALGGCAIDDEAEETSEVASDLTSTFATGMLTCSSSLGCSVTIAPIAANRSCFIGGVKGYLQNGSIYITVINGQNTLRVEPQPGHTLSASATCITNATPAYSQHWFGGDPAVSLGSGATRHCAISAIYNQNAFTAQSDFTRTWKDANNHWWLGGSTPNKDTTVWATCWDGSATYGGWDYAWTSSTAVDVTLSQDAPGGGVACLLTKVGGFFTAATDEAQIYWNAPTTTWRARLARSSLQSYCVI